MTHFDVLCVGSATLDTIATTAAYPAEDTRVEADAVVTAGGGPAATAAVALARLGVRVAFAGAVGEDEAGRRIRADLEAEGVDTRWLRPTAAASGASVVLVSGDGARTIITRPAPAPTEIPTDAAAWVHADQTGWPAVAAARAAGMSARVSVDAGNPIDGLSLAGLDLYAPTLSALRSRYPGAELEDALSRAEADGARWSVVTDGSRGAHYRGDGSHGSIPAVPIAPVSTLGAGDVFHGALLAAIVGGADLRRAVEAASWVAATSCAGLDGRSAIPRRDALHARFPDLHIDQSPRTGAERVGTPT